ncbi:MAG: hypothetical protein KDI29_00240, partial [Pseudomonadales bacterium]|nr:hypothetical protein [Pseudomonadales bacterium]
MSYSNSTETGIRKLHKLLIGLLFSGLATVAAAAPAIIPRPPEIAASSYILMDAKTGFVID